MHAYHKAKRAAENCPQDPKGIDLIDAAIERVPIVRWLISTRLFKKLRAFYIQHPDIVNTAVDIASLSIKEAIKKLFEKWAGRSMKSWEQHALSIFCALLPLVF